MLGNIAAWLVALVVMFFVAMALTVVIGYPIEMFTDWLHATLGDENFIALGVFGAIVTFYFLGRFHGYDSAFKRRQGPNNKLDG